MKALVLTFIANDTPGLVKKLSDAVNREGGNWLESRMAHLAEKFAGIARVEIPDDRLHSLTNALAALETKGFRITIEEATSGEAPGGTLLILDLVGPDHPGIVYDISRCLADRGVSIEQMETDLRQAPMGGGPLFYARARVRAPAGLDEQELRNALEGLSAALMVDVALRDGA
jgi:glycine cleavage system regulatory protein